MSNMFLITLTFNTDKSQLNVLDYVSISEICSGDSKHKTPLQENEFEAIVIL